MMSTRAARTHRVRSILSGIALLLGFQAATFAGISQAIFTLQAVNDDGAASIAIDYAAGNWDPVNQRFTWQLAAPTPLLDGGATIATLNSASLTINYQPTLSVHVTLGARAGFSDTTFLMDSAVVSFASVPASTAAGAFLAGCTVADSGANDGMWLYEPGLAGFGAFQACYNTNPDPEGVFSNLLALVGGSGGGTATASEIQPSSGYNPFNADVSDMTVCANFVLTDRDCVQANATFTLIPEPTAAVLLLVGAFFLRGRVYRR